MQKSVLAKLETTFTIANKNKRTWWLWYTFKNILRMLDIHVFYFLELWDLFEIQCTFTRFRSVWTIRNYDYFFYCRIINKQTAKMYDMRTKFRQWRTCVSLLKAETHQHRVVYFEMVIFQIINISQRKSETIFILRNKYRL
jgi:hypothetical protein